jgi:membrane protein
MADRLLLVAAVLGLATVIEPWKSALIVGITLAAIGAAVSGLGWSHRLKNPFEATRASLKEDVQWMNNRLA